MSQIRVRSGGFRKSLRRMRKRSRAVRSDEIRTDSTKREYLMILFADRQYLALRSDGAGSERHRTSREPTERGTRAKDGTLQTLNLLTEQCMMIDYSTINELPIGQSPLPLSVSQDSIAFDGYGLQNQIIRTTYIDTDDLGRIDLSTFDFPRDDGGGVLSKYYR